MADFPQVRILLPTSYFIDSRPEDDRRQLRNKAVADRNRNEGGFDADSDDTANHAVRLAFQIEAERIVERDRAMLIGRLREVGIGLRPHCPWARPWHCPCGWRHHLPPCGPASSSL